MFVIIFLMFCPNYFVIAQSTSDQQQQQHVMSFTSTTTTSSSTPSTSLTSESLALTSAGPLVTQLPGGIIKDGQHIITKSKSPYLIREDLIIERDAELVIEPGVEIRFGSMVGITVRGRLNAMVCTKFILIINN